MVVGGQGGNGAAGRGGASPGQGGAGGGPAPFCDVWTPDLSLANQRALELHGLFESKAILEGKLGERIDIMGRAHARFTIARVRAGIAFHAGREVAIEMGPGLHALFGAGASLVVGLSSTASSELDATTLPVWTAPLAVLRADQIMHPEDALGFRAWHAPNVFVVRVRELPPDRVGFDVLETLAGTPTAAFLANWASNWGPLPLVVGDEFVIGVSEFIDSGGTKLATAIIELRPNSADERARALRGIATLAPDGFATKLRGGLEQARNDAINYRLAWTFARSERVVGVEVAGRASECCTDAGGTYFSNTVTDVLRGASPPLPLMTGGHGVNNTDQCGDRFFLALRSVATIPDGSQTKFTCTAPAGMLQGGSSSIEARLPATMTNRENVTLWLGSPPPLLRMIPSGMEAPNGAFDRPVGPAPLSLPVPLPTALQAGHALSLFTIVDVRDNAGGGYAVRVSTPLYVRELPHLVNREATLFYPCADRRLLEVGRRWIGAVMGSEPFLGSPNTTLGLQLGELRLMLIPGVLIPEEREDLVRSAELFRSVVIARPLGP